jgi:hypothetical protein
VERQGAALALRVVAGRPREARSVRGLEMRRPQHLHRTRELRAPGPGPRRRYYRITRSGIESLDSQIREWETFAQSIRLVTDAAVANG